MSRTRIDPNPFGDWLRDQIERSGMGRKEVAHAIGVELASVNAWIGGWRHISAENADAVAEFFGAPRNEVREMARRPPLSGPAPGMIGLRGMSGRAGAATVALVPILGIIPRTNRSVAELGEVMPFAAEVAARLKQPGIIMIADDSLSQRGINRGAHLLVEQDFEFDEVRPGNLVIAEEGEGHVVYTWFEGLDGSITLVPVSGVGAPLPYDPETNEPPLVGVARLVYSIRSVE